MRRPVPPQQSRPRRLGRRALLVDRIVDATSLSLPNLRRCQSPVDQVELRRAIFQEARADLRVQESLQEKDFRLSGPAEKFKTAAWAVRRGTHIVIVESDVVARWREAAGYVNEATSTAEAKCEGDMRAMLNKSGPSDGSNTTSERYDVDLLLSEFEIMSDGVPTLRDSQDFQESAQQLISGVHNTIATLVNLHDRASTGIAESVEVRARFVEQAAKAQQLWSKIKDDIDRIRKLRGQCEAAGTKQEFQLSALPTPFIKIVEHSLDSLGIVSAVCAKKRASQIESLDVCRGDVGFNIELATALGGGSYQRLVDCWDSLAELSCEVGTRHECEEDDSGELDEHLLRFLDECRGSLTEGPQVTDAPDQDGKRLELTDDHVMTKRRFMKPGSCTSLGDNVMFLEGSVSNHNASDVDPSSSCHSDCDSDSLLSVEDSASCATAAAKDVQSTSPCSSHGLRPLLPHARFNTYTTEVLPATSPQSGSYWTQTEGRRHQGSLEPPDCGAASSCVAGSLDPPDCGAGSSCAVKALVSEDAGINPSHNMASVDIEDFLVLESSAEDFSSSQSNVVSHRGRSFLVAGLAMSQESSSLLPAPPSQRRQTHYVRTGPQCEDSDVESSSSHSSSDSLPALRKARTLNLESVNSSDEERARSQLRKSGLRVRGRSFCNSTRSARPSPIPEEELSLKLAALTSPKFDADASTAASAESSECTSTATSRVSSACSSRAASRGRARLLDLADGHRSRASSVHSSYSSSSTPFHEWSSGTSLCLEPAERTLGGWAIVKQKLCLPLIVGRRASM